MAVLSNPAAASLDGTETLSLRVGPLGGTITMGQLKAYVNGQAIGAGASNPPVGQPAVTSLAGTEQAALFQSGPWIWPTLTQLAAVLIAGGTFGGALAASDALLIKQAGGMKSLSLATLAAWIAS